MKKLLLLFVLFIVFTGCTQFEEPIMPNDNEVITRVVDGEDINPTALRAAAGVADKNNPYSYKNMQSAAKVLGIYWGRPIQINATHNYVRFLPQDSIQLYTLTKTLKLELFDYPIDRDLTDAEMNFYSNDLINGYCWKYTLVPKLYWNFPEGIRKEILDEACLLVSNTTGRSLSTHEANAAAVGAVGLSESDYNSVVEQAMKTAGMITDGSVTSGWSPSAQIGYVDDATNQTIPLEKVRVRVNTTFNIGYGYTDANGKVTITKGWGGEFKNPVKYRMLFETDKWMLHRKRSGQAEIYGPEQKGLWICNINHSDLKNSTYAAIHRALVYFFYKQSAIYAPDRYFKVAVLWDEESGSNGDYRLPMEFFDDFGSPIRIWGKSNSEYRPRHMITQTTFHELAHFSHAHIKGSKFISGSRTVAESYARTVQYYLIKSLYNDYQTNFNPEYFTDYTAVGVSLLNQGFSMTQLQTPFTSQPKWIDLRQDIKNIMGSGVQGAVIDFIFDNGYFCWSNLQTESIEYENAQENPYVNQQTTLVLNQDFDGTGVVASNWTVTPNYFTINSTTNTTATITFTQTGSYSVSCTLTPPNGIPFRVQKSFTVKNFPSVVGNKELRVGVMTSYRMSDYAYLRSWQVGKYDSNGKLVSCNSDVIKSTTETINVNGVDVAAFNILGIEPGDYVIRAVNIANGTTINVDYPITVSVEHFGKDDFGWKPLISICEVNARQHITTGEVRLVIFNGDIHRIDSDYEDLPSGSIFMAFCRRPQKDHPYYSDMKDILLYKNYGGTNCYAYSYGPIINLPNSNLPNTIGEGTPALYLLKTAKPGTIPIYSIDVLTYDGTRLLTANRYLCRTNVDNTTEYNGTKRKIIKNYGIIGYAFSIGKL